MQHGKYRFIVGFLVIPLALYAIFVIWPFIQAIYYSFTDWTGLSPDFKMVGFDNYTQDVQRRRRSGSPCSTACCS